MSVEVTPCGNDTPVQVAVELANVPARAEQLTVASFPCSELRCSVTTVPTASRQTSESGFLNARRGRL